MAVITNKLTLVLFLVACMAAATLNNVGHAAAFDICALTNFKETCHKSLAGAPGTKPKDLIKAEIDAASVEVRSVIKKVAAFKKRAPSDHFTQRALTLCEELLDSVVFDLRRSANKVNEIEIGRLVFNIGDVRNWLSASVTHKENCLDALLESTKGGIVEKVKAMLKTSSELLSNGLAMIAKIDPRLLGDGSHDQAIPPAVAAPPRNGDDGVE